MIKKPMLAGIVIDTADLKYPIIATPKIDGIRALKIDGEVVSRSLKPIRNNFIRAQLGADLPEGADGEILVGETFQETTSAVMSIKGKPDFEFAFFDWFNKDNPAEPYKKRIMRIDWRSEGNVSKFVRPLPWIKLMSENALLTYEQMVLENGFEGVMVRDPDGPYKFGRSTSKEGYLLKLKRFADSEAEILEIQEGERNLNPAKINKLGLIERSTAKAGTIPSGSFGRFIVRDLETGQVFGIGNGPGLTHEIKAAIWAMGASCIGLIVKYRYQEVGSIDAPRFPQFLGFRDGADM